MNQITSLKLGNHVATIGQSSFQMNKLTEVAIPNSVQTIDGSAFLSNEIETLSLGTGVTTIGNAAFNNNNLTSIEIPSSVTTIQGGVLAANNNLSTVVNKTGRTFNWCNALGATLTINGNTYNYEDDECVVETGEFTKDSKTITVSK